MTRQWSRLDRRNAGASRHGCNPRHDRAADEEGTCPPHATLVYADKDERAPAALGAPVALSPLQSPLLLLLGSPLVPRQAGAMPPRRLTALFRAVFSAHATRFFHMVHARSFFHVWRFSSSPLSFQLSPPFFGVASRRSRAARKRAARALRYRIAATPALKPGIGGEHGALYLPDGRRTPPRHVTELGPIAGQRGDGERRLSTYKNTGARGPVRAVRADMQRDDNPEERIEKLPGRK